MNNDQVHYQRWDGEDRQVPVIAGGKQCGHITIKKGDAVVLDWGRSVHRFNDRTDAHAPCPEFEHGRLILQGKYCVDTLLNPGEWRSVKLVTATRADFNAVVEAQVARIGPEYQAAQQAHEAVDAAQRAAAVARAQEARLEAQRRRERDAAERAARTFDHHVWNGPDLRTTLHGFVKETNRWHELGEIAIKKGDSVSLDRHDPQILRISYQWDMRIQVHLTDEERSQVATLHTNRAGYVEVSARTKARIEPLEQSLREAFAGVIAREGVEALREEADRAVAARRASVG